MEISKTEIGNALTSADENHILATANDIYDETQQAYQSEINQSLAEGKQDKLVSGTNIKTINGTSLLGSGDVSISGGGGGDFNASGNYPNLTAGKATKLATARTISLSGATVGCATFDGTKDVDININSIPQGYIQWAGKNSIGSLSPLEATAPLFSTNRFALINPECVIIEYSQDGGNTWIKHPNDASPSAKTYLFTPEVSTVNLALGNKASNQETTHLDMLRVTINGIAMTRYFSINTFLVYMSNINDSSVRCSFSRTTWGGDIINSKDYQVIGWPAWNTINLTTPIPFGNNNIAYVTKEITFTFKLIGNVARPPIVCNIACIANTLYKVETVYPKTGHLYKFDYLKNATFPARVTAAKHITQGGSANQVVLGDGSLRPISELSPITDADAEILLDNHIHSIDVKASGEDVNINIIESTKNGNAWETTEKNVTIPVATQETAGVISAADKKKINAINYKDNTIFVGDGMDGTLSIGHESSKASSEMRVFHDRYATIHVTSYNDTTGGSIVAMDSMGGKGTVEVNGDQLAELSLSGAGQVCATLTKKNEDGTKIKTIIDAAEGITAPKLATIGGTSEQILLGDGTLITFDELKAKLGLI